MATDTISVVLRGDNQLSAAVGAARRDLRGMQDAVGGVSRIMGTTADLTRVFAGEQSKLAQAIATVTGTINLATGALVGLRGALMAVLGPKGLIIAAIGAVVGGFVLWRRRAEEAAAAQRALAQETTANALAALDRAKERQFALAAATDRASDGIRRQIAATRDHIRQTEEMLHLASMTAEQRKQAEGQIERNRNALIVLEAQLRRSIQGERDAAAAAKAKTVATREKTAAIGENAAALRELQEELIATLEAERRADEIRQVVVPRMTALAQTMRHVVLEAREQSVVSARLAADLQDVTRGASLTAEQMAAVATVMQTQGVGAAREMVELFGRVAREMAASGPVYEDYHQRLRRITEEGPAAARAVQAVVVARDVELLRVQVELGEAHVSQLIAALKVQESLALAENRALDAARIRLEIERQQRAAGEAIRRQRTDEIELLRLQVSLGEATTGELIAALRAYEKILIAEKRIAEAARVRVEILRIQPVVLGQWDALMGQIRAGAEQMQNELARIFGGLAPGVLGIVRGIGEAVGQLFTDLVSGAKSLGNAIADFFGNVARSIVNMIAQLLAQAAVAWLLSFIIPGFGFRFFFRGLTGLAKGGVIPSAQEGGVTRGVTPALLHPREVVLPLPPGLRPEDLAKAIHREGPTELNLQLAIVFDPRQIPPPPEDHTQAVVVADIRRRGPIFQTLRLAGAR